MPRDHEALLDMLHAALAAIEASAGLELNDLKTEWIKRSAILHQLTVLGEAAKRVTMEHRAEHGQIPWKKITGMRDVLVHEYDGVDYQEVLATVKKDLPGLVAELRKLVPRELK
jgi:uncharacterized protein with HEPN domain